MQNHKNFAKVQVLLGQLAIYEISFATRKIRISAKIVAFDLMRLVRFVWHIHKFFSFFSSEHFPYFKNAPSGWKNSVRHNLSLNKCFEKIEKPASNGSQRKGCLWAMNPNKIQKMNEEVQKWSRKDPQAIKKGMAMPGTSSFSIDF